MSFVWLIMHLIPLLSQLCLVCLLPLSLWILWLQLHDTSLVFSELKHAQHPLNICTTNGSTMSGHNIGSISTSNLSVLGVFNVPNLSYSLFFVGQLAELDCCIIFDYSGYIV